MTEDVVRKTLALALTLAAGCVDASAFLDAGVFPANMTGNSVMLALGLAHAGAGGEIPAALVLLGFCAGVAAGAWYVRSPEGVWSRSVNTVFAFAGLLIIACGMCLRPGAGEFLLSARLVGISAAMGLQSIAVLHLNIPGASTSTVITGTLTTAVARVVTGFGPGRPSPAFPGMVWGAYFAGALASGLLHALHPALPSIFPGMLLFAVAAVAEWKIPHKA